MLLGDSPHRASSNLVSAAPPVFTDLHRGTVLLGGKVHALACLPRGIL